MATESVTSDVLVLANAVTATGAQPSKFFSDYHGHIQSFAVWTVQVSGTATSISMEIDGSLDGTNWNKIAAGAANPIVTAPSAGVATYSFGASGTAYPYVRANITTLAGGNVTALAVGAS